MGTLGENDGGVYLARLDGSDARRIVGDGAVHMPKQPAVEPAGRKLYFCDREGLRVLRCDLDGSALETLVQNGDWRNGAERGGRGGRDGLVRGHRRRAALGKFYWTQKAASKSGQARILCADIVAPEGCSAGDRPDVQVLAEGLPEPVDLDVDAESRTLYWMDRGELPFGNT